MACARPARDDGGVGWIPYLVATLLFLAGGACVLGVVVQLPGTWILLALALAVELVDGLYLPVGAPATFDTAVLLACLGLALLGEGLEFLAGILGLRKGGGTNRGLWGSLVGAFLGLFLLTPLFAFVPFFGALLGVLLGTFLGALVGEYTHQRRTLGAALRPALWAALGRLLGTGGKVAVAAVVWAALTVSAFAS